MTDSTALTTTTNASSGQELAFLHDTAAFDHLWRVAKAFSLSRMVPQHFQGKPEDCMVALMMAQQLGVNPLLSLQNLQVINGRAGFSAAFAIGLANQRGPFTGPITWSQQGQGDDLEVTAQATIRATGEIVTSTVSMGMAKAEGWVKNPKYRSIPGQMLRYRSATWLIRLHCPEVLMGLSSSEELEDVHGVKVVTVREEVSSPAPTGDVVAQLNQQIKKRGSNATPAAPVQPPTHEEQQQPATEPVEVEATDADDPF